MKLTKEALKQIIKEELENVLMEQHFDTKTGFPITSAGAKKALSNPKTMERMKQAGNTFVKIIRWAVDASTNPKIKEEYISDTLKDFSDKWVQASEINAGKREAEEKLQRVIQQGEQRLRDNRLDLNSKEIQLAEKWINAFTEDKERFLKQVEELGDDHYRKRFPNWDAMKKIMLDTYDKQIEIQKQWRASIGNRGMDNPSQ